MTYIKAKNRGRQLIRCLRLAREIENRQITTDYIHELSKRYGVCTRTLRRDFVALQKAGIVVRYGTGSAIDVVDTRA